MRRAAIAVAAAAALLGAAPAAHARVDNGAKPVVFIAGEESGRIDCSTYWGAMTSRMRRYSTTIQGATVKLTGEFVLTGEGEGCAVKFPAGGGIEEQADRFADWLTLTFKGEDVDVVAQGTAGVMVRVAMKRAKLAIEDVVTIGAPHDGSKALAAKCPSSRVCAELDPDDPAGMQFLFRLSASPDYAHPQGKNGTDWTLIGSASDSLVKADSALAMDADHKTVYTKPELDHEELHADASAKRDATISYSHRETETIEWRKAPHVADRVAADLIVGAVPAATQTGCTGSNDTTGGAVRVDDPGLLQFGPGRDQLSYIKTGPLEAYSACFKKNGDGLLVSDTKVRLNGLDIVPAAGERVLIDPKTRRVTSGKMTMTIPSKWFDALPIPLYQDERLDWSLPKEGGSLQGTDIDGLGASGGIKIGGFAVKGSHRLTVQQGAMVLELSLAFPGIFSGTGWTAPGQANKAQCSNGIDDDRDGKIDYGSDDECKTPADNYESAADGPGFLVTIRADNVRGLMVDKLGGTVEGNMRLGPIKILSASAWYSFADNEWEASLSTVLPFPQEPTLKATVAFKNGVLKSISAEVDNLQWGPLGSSNLYLQRAKLGYVYQPSWEVTVGTTLSFWRRFQTDDGYKALIEWIGDLTVSASSTKLAGKITVLGSEWGNGSLEVKYGDEVSGVLQAGLTKDIEFADRKDDPRAKLKVAVNGSFTGTVDKTGLQTDSKASVCFEGSLKFGVFEGNVESTCLAQGTGRMSAKTGLFAGSVCGQLDVGVYNLAVGAAFKRTAKAPGGGEASWEGKTWAGACDVDDWHTPAGAAQAGGARAVTIGSGLDGAVIGVEGRDAPPHVALTGPGGARIPAPASATGIVRGDGYALVHWPATKMTYVVIANPKAGRWTVQPQADSSPVAELRSADTLPQPSVTATVTGRGRTRVLRYDVKAIPGQVVRFREVGRGVSASLGTARRNHGRLRFRPAYGKGGTRRIVAEVVQRGYPRAEVTAGRYVAPKPVTPRAPKRVTLKRRGSRLAIAWSRVDGARGYAVAVVTGDGRRIGYETKARRVTVRNVLGSRASRVTVRALRPDGRFGKARTVSGGAALP